MARALGRRREVWRLAARPGERSWCQGRWRAQSLPAGYSRNAASLHLKGTSTGKGLGDDFPPRKLCCRSWLTHARLCGSTPGHSRPGVWRQLPPCPPRMPGGHSSEGTSPVVRHHPIPLSQHISAGATRRPAACPGLPGRRTVYLSTSRGRHTSLPWPPQPCPLQARANWQR